jgi:KDO2-lipid IV(A) lauroyltransferase
MRPLPLWLGYRVAGAVSLLCYPFFTRQTGALHENFGLLLQTDDRAATGRLARAAFRNFGKFVIDFVRFPVLTKDEVRKRLVFNQWVELDEAMASKRGLILVTMHYGVFDLGAAALATYGYPTNAIVDNYGYARMDELIHSSRREMGINVIPADKVSMGVFRALKRGEILAMLVDVAPPGLVVRGPERDELIRPILDTQALRSFEQTGDEERDVREMTRRIMAALEKPLRQHPEQWFIFHRLWRHAADRALAGPDRGG